MKEERKKFIIWVKAHKKQLLIAGISIGAVVLLILGLKNKKELINFFEILENSVNGTADKVSGVESAEEILQSVMEKTVRTRTYTLPQEPVDVSLHLRTMSAGMHHSPEKAAEAAELGIHLLPNQTIVDSYMKYMA